jgi:hypothetical protein
MQHTNLVAGRRNNLSSGGQMANVGSEVERTITWEEKGNADYCCRASKRALEHLDLAIADEKNRKRLKVVVRVRESLAGYFCFDNEYRSTDVSWSWYFHGFNDAARVNRWRT